VNVPDEAALAALVEGPAAAVDFGGTNVDVLVCRDGAFVRRFVHAGRPLSPNYLRELLRGSGVVSPRELRLLAVTGGRYRTLPDALDGTPIYKIEELRAIGRGGRTAAGLDEALVVSLGTGTAIVGARGRQLRHLGGSGVGGGTLLGLSRLLLGTTEAAVIDTLAERGDPTRVDLTVGDIVGGPVGVIPASATASHFGKASGVVAGAWVGSPEQAGREHVAAALMNLVGQTTMRIALLAATAHGYDAVVLLGHLLDLPSFQRAAGLVGSLFGGRAIVPPHPGFAIALGALLEAADEHAGA